MTDETLVIGLVRLTGALPVLRWPLAGAIIAILVDLFDLVLMNYLELGGLPNYQAFDKLADLAYLTTFLVVSLRWRGLARRVAVALFAARIIGVAAFEITGAREVLAMTPNVFEFWFLFVAARNRFAPGYELNGRNAASSLGILTGLKLAQEYLLHVDRRLDNYLLRDLVDTVLERLTTWG